MIQTKSDRKKIAPDELKGRVLSLKAKMKKGWDYTTLYIYAYGQQTEAQKTRIREVWNLRVADLEITERLEKLAKKMNS